MTKPSPAPRRPRKPKAAPVENAWIGDYLLLVDDMVRAAGAVLDTFDNDDEPDPLEMALLGNAVERMKRADPDVSPEEQKDRATIEAHVEAGHTAHCAKRMVWGDGECECAAQRAPTRSPKRSTR